MLKPGDTFERYTIEAAIGQGGMGAVYRAHDARLGRRVALKVLTSARDGEEASARLLREARAAAALDHPNAVSIFEVGELEGSPYIAMELVSGRTLRAVIAEAPAPPVETRLDWLADVARVLAAAHRRGLVHRDIKPENVMVRDDGVVKVLDFGIARRASFGAADPHGSTQAAALPTLTTEGVTPGTPVYMAPEQIRGEALDGRADQFAWGVLAYELLAGRPPWRGGGDLLAVLASVLTDPIDPGALEAAPPPVREVILRALERRPEDRFASMDDLVEALEAAVRGDPLPAGGSPARADRPAPGATQAQRFATEEVRAVLAQAIERQAKRGDARLGFEELLAVAAEVGVDERSLREASRALRAQKERPAAPAAEEERPAAREERALEAREGAVPLGVWLRRKRREFRRHLGVYLIVNGALSTLLLLVGAPLVAVLATPLMWGIGLGIHGLVALSADEDDWAEEQEKLAYWRERKRRGHELAMARAAGKGARAMAAGPRQRLEEAGARVRVEVKTRDDVAEEEAALAEEEERERRRGRRRG